MAKTTALAGLNVGDELKPVSQVVTQDRINHYADVSGDHNPLHLDEEFARTTIFGGIIAHGLLSLAFLSRMMGENFGRYWIKGGELEVSFVAPVRPGDTVTAKGTVAEKRQEDGRTVAVCDAWCENQRGEKVIVGKTIVRE